MSQDISMIYVAVSQPDQPLAVLQIIQRAPEQCFDEISALNNGFKLVEGYWEREVTPEVIEFTVSKAQFSEANYRVISLEEYQELGKNRDFRDAWMDDGKELSVSLEKAKEIVKSNLRKERSEKFKTLDTEQLKALVSKDELKIQEYEVEKQRLRDITIDPKFDTATSLDDLRAIKIEG